MKKTILFSVFSILFICATAAASHFVAVVSGGGAWVTKYTSDFSAGADSWTGNPVDTSVDGNIDGISDGGTSYDDVLRFTMGDTAGTYHHCISGNPGFSAGDKVRVTYKYYIPAGNTVIDGFLSTGYGNAENVFQVARSVDAGAAVVGTWTSFSSEEITLTQNMVYLRFTLTDGADYSPDGNGTDVFYVRDVVIERFE
jgi:hypothetical protein